MCNIKIWENASVNSLSSFHLDCCPFSAGKPVLLFFLIVIDFYLLISTLTILQSVPHPVVRVISKYKLYYVSSLLKNILWLPITCGEKKSLQAPAFYGFCLALQPYIVPLLLTHATLNFFQLLKDAELIGDLRAFALAVTVLSCNVFCPSLHLATTLLPTGLNCHQRRETLTCSSY